uniref:Transcriptional regulator ATRX n=2 Tax=Bactrocera latifrons TaxID=174628 RepID=A0A0K8U902_BACLA
MPKFRRCRVRGCESTSGGVVRLFSFPNDRELAEKWKHNLKIFPTDHFPSTNAFVCEKHFAKAAIGTKMLKKNTVPTLNLDIEFDASLADEERRFYLRAYPSVDLVRERKVHCTVCKTHIGTAPSQEENIRMHPVLRVTHCLKCHDFYNSGEFSKGEDGSELYCRWCGQGGEVYCCSSCPYVFCKSCIVKNLSRGVVVDIEQNENWNCFSCAPKILWPLRAQHWALIRYIDKQKKYIDVNHPNESEKRALLSQDRSTCCRLAKSKCGNMSDSMESLDSATSRRSQSSSSAKKHSKSPGNHPQVPPAKRMKNSNDEVVCTPDLLSMLEPDCQITVQQKTRPAPSPITSTPKIISLQTHSSSPNSSGITLKPHNNTPPPLVLRNTGIPIRHPSPAPIVRRTIIGARNAPTTGNHTPVYHTINGYRIDLNSAAQQETFRLPNGKLIQVKRQGTNQPQPSTPSPSNAWMRQASPITAIQHAASGRPVQITPARTYYSVSQQHQQNSMQQPQMIRYSNTTVTPVSGQNGAIRGTQIQLINGVPVAPTAAPATVNSATAVRAPVMVRHVFPDTAIGQARSQLQDQVFNAMEICQHLTGKVQTLTNSNAYKQARNYLEVKELYIHLSYLLTYAIGRFKGLQDKCLGDMRQLGFVNDADSLENGQLAADKQASDDEDNEIEIVEPKTDTITLDSDNEDEAPVKQTDTPKPPQLVTIINTAASSNSACQLSPNDNRQKLILKEQLTLPKGTTIVPTAPVPSLNKLPSPSNSIAVTINNSNEENNAMEEVDMMSAAKKFLVSLLEVDSDAAEGSWSADGSEQQQQRKQPRKKTTNKPNPTLLKQKEMLERERLEEMKRNDLKLKMKCAISLKKAEEEYPFAKDMLQQHENESKAEKCAGETQRSASEEKQEEVATCVDNGDTKKPDESNEAGNENDSGDMEILTVDLESSIDDGKETEIVLEGEKSPAEKSVEGENNGSAEKYTIVMDDEDEGKEKSLIIEVEGNSSSEKESLQVVIDENTANSNDDSNEKCTKTKMETVSECAKRVIEGLQASEKQKEIEMNEQQQTKVASPDMVSSVDNASADDIIEPIVVEESDVADSEDSPIKQKMSEVTNDYAVTTANSTESAAADDVIAARREAPTNSGLVACAIKAATERETNAVELNEPEIDVEKEIEMLLMKKAQLPEAETNTNTEASSAAADTQAEKAPIAQPVTPELLSDLADNLLESARATHP